MDFVNRLHSGIIAKLRLKDSPSILHCELSPLIRESQLPLVKTSRFFSPLVVPWRPLREECFVFGCLTQRSSQAEILNQALAGKKPSPILMTSMNQWPAKTNTVSAMHLYLSRISAPRASGHGGYCFTSGVIAHL